jgi:hypothetical protein
MDTRSQALPGNALVWRLLPPEFTNEDAFRRGGASLASSYQAEPGNWIAQCNKTCKPFRVVAYLLAND